jgi:hypothetical protein
MTKYYLSVYAIFKNESVALEEWLTHYINEGVDHFFLIDNGSTDDYEPILDKFPGRITLYKDPEPYKQNDHYNNYLFKHNTESQWIILVDLDEFVYARNGFDKISDYLKSVPENISRISLRWKMFGSNGHIEQPPSIIKGFTKRGTPFVGERNWKSILRGDKIICLDVHFSPVHGETLTPETHDFYLHLNHYRAQSYNWFKKVKCTRGDAFFHGASRGEHDFKNFDFNEVEDLELAQKRN